MKRASVSDVAKSAGVSTATVSRVLNEPEKVSEKTRQRVLQAIDKLRFVKSATAFSFKVRQTHTVLVVATNVGNIYYSEIFAALHQSAAAQGYRISLASLKPGDVSRQITDYLRAGRVDGVIMLDSFDLEADDYDMLSVLYGGTPPIVGFAEKPGLLRYPHVFIDNYKAAYAATCHLIGAGHRRIGHVTGPPGRPVTGERLRGFADAMTDAGLAPAPEDIFDADFHREQGKRVGREIAARAQRPTAMFCASDEIAMGLISELAILGIRTPEDISVIGFDDIVLADAYVPRLTTVSQPLGGIGRSAFALLREAMGNPAATAGKVVELQAGLTSRASVMPPNPPSGPKNR